MSNCLGSGVKRYDGLNHVTGRTTYTDDYPIPRNTLMVKAYRSPVANGEVLSIDTSEAERLPGVKAIITNADIPHTVYDVPILAKSIRYRGEPVAAVAAVDEETAMKAVALLKVNIKEQTPALDPIEAMKPDAPKVRPEGNVHKYTPEHDAFQCILGDVEAGFREADLIVEEDYLLPSVEHCPIEPSTSLAIPEPDGRLTVYGMSQGVHNTLKRLFMCIQAEPNSPDCARWDVKYRQRGITSVSDIKFIGGITGGGFGGKVEPLMDPVTCILALITGCPVKWCWTREEEFMYSTYRGAWHLHIKDGIKKNGQLIARHVRSIRNAGGYIWNNDYVVQKHCFNVCGPYFIPNLFVEGYVVLTNRPIASGMRGYGLTPATFAVEVQMDRIAHELGIDPWEFRLMNAFHNGDLNASHSVLDSVYMIECLQKLAERSGVKLADEFVNMSSAPRR